MNDLLPVLERIAVAVESLRADLRRAAARDPARLRDLDNALVDCFGADEQISVAALLELADTDPHCAVADALARLVDLAGAGRSVALGRLLARSDRLELIGDRRGAALYRVRD